MPTRETRGSLLALRERYLWLWQKLQKLEQKLTTPAHRSSDSQRSGLWAERMKQQLKRYWP